MLKSRLQTQSVSTRSKRRYKKEVPLIPYGYVNEIFSLYASIQFLWNKCINKYLSTDLHHVQSNKWNGFHCRNQSFNCYLIVQVNFIDNFIVKINNYLILHHLYLKEKNKKSCLWNLFFKYRKFLLWSIQTVS